MNSRLRLAVSPETSLASRAMVTSGSNVSAWPLTEFKLTSKQMKQARILFAVFIARIVPPEPRCATPVDQLETRAEWQAESPTLLRGRCWVRTVAGCDLSPETTCSAPGP